MKVIVEKLHDNEGAEWLRNGKGILGEFVAFV